MQLQQWSINATCVEKLGVFVGRAGRKRYMLIHKVFFSPILNQEHLKRQTGIVLKNKHLQMKCEFLVQRLVFRFEWVFSRAFGENLVIDSFKEAPADPRNFTSFLGCILKEMEQVTARNAAILLNFCMKFTPPKRSKK